MQRRIILLIAVLGLAIPGILKGLPAGPTSPSNPADATPPSNLVPGTSLSNMSDFQAENLSQLNREIRALLLRERAEVATRTALLQSIQDPMAALAAQREISDLKSTTQISILEVQGRFARAEGRIEQADEIAVAVERMKERQAARVTNRSRR